MVDRFDAHKTYLEFSLHCNHLLCTGTLSFILKPHTPAPGESQ